MIRFQNIRKEFDGFVAVADFNLEVHEGELLVLLGGSGSGKTTTLKMVNRLIEPTSGSITIAGHNILEDEAHLLRRRIGYCFQRIGLFPHMTVAENIGVTPKLLGWAPGRIAARVDELLELVQLEPGDFRERMPEELSGGQQQRIGVARALAAQPEVILFDEPFGALDPLTRDDLQRSLATLRQQLGFTSIFVTHDMVEAILLGDRIAVMRDGELLQHGTARELLHAPADDYVRELIDTPARQADALESLLEGDAT